MFFSESTRSRAFDLVGRAYASISAEDLSAFVGLPVVEAVEGNQLITLVHLL